MLQAVSDAIWRNQVAIPWQTGDFVAIDNRRISHGRLPYRGPRTIVVAWA
jgi:alpha-ketoglutarate-dependent taurine dioxygenase